MNELTSNSGTFDVSRLSTAGFPGPRMTRDDLQARTVDGEKFVVFYLDEELFAVCARDIAEVIRPLTFTPLPDSPPWLHGIGNLRGEIVTVINLSRIFRKKGTPATSKNKMIVLKAIETDSPVAFPIDRLYDIVILTPGEIEPAPDFRIIGKAPHSESHINLLDIDQLFSSL